MLKCIHKKRNTPQTNKSLLKEERF